MSIDRFLVHRVSLVRRVAVLDGDGAPTLDDYGQPVTAESTTTDIAAAIQPRSARELAAISQGGAVLTDHRIYMLPRDVSTADVIVHDPDTCPRVTDLPAGRYEITGVPDAAGEGHHLEIEAKRIGTPTTAYAVAEVAGS